MISRYLFSAVLVCVLLAYTGMKAFSLGKENERAAWLKKELDQLAITTKQLQDLHDEARAKESLANVELNNVRDQLSEAQNEIINRDSVINQQYADIARLRFNTDTLRTDTSESSTVTASTKECDGETITELSPEVFRYVYERFAECDEIVEQLSACQAVVEIDRNIFVE